MSGSNYGSGNYGVGLYSLNPYTLMAAVGSIVTSGVANLARAATFASSMPITISGNGDTSAFGPLWDEITPPADFWNDTTDAPISWQDVDIPTNPWGANG